MKKDKRSLLMKIAIRFQNPLANKINGWLWAGNSIMQILIFVKYDGTWANMFWAIFCFIVAVVFWNRADLEIKK